MEGWIIGLIIVVLLILIVCLVIYKLMVIVHQAEGMVIERLGRFHKVRSVWKCVGKCGRSVWEKYIPATSYKAWTSTHLRTNMQRFSHTCTGVVFRASFATPKGDVKRWSKDALEAAQPAQPPTSPPAPALPARPSRPAHVPETAVKYEERAILCTPLPPSTHLH